MILSSTRSGVPETASRSGLKRRALIAGAVVVAAGAGAAGGVLGTRYFLLGVDDSVLDTHHRSDAEFFAQMRMSGALDVIPPSLTEAIKMSSVVLVGEIVDVRATEPVTGEVPTDKFYGVGLVVRPLDVVQGSLPLRFRDELTLDLMFGATGPTGSLETIRAGLPQGPAVFFLRSGEDAANNLIEHWEKRERPVPGGTARLDRDRQYYGLVSYNGILVQGPDHVLSPAWEPELIDGMAEEARTYKKLSDLVAYLRTLDSVPVGTRIG
ncbi:hypothetical protein [Actinopolymorpha sp. B9G3]|uniref:hypothetical protein n=1 Tax=Actinopolymorpha sp. B9G3 TaxID=3158970 RepID=UPI0032D8E34E